MLRWNLWAWRMLNYKGVHTKLISAVGGRETIANPSSYASRQIVTWMLLLLSMSTPRDEGPREPSRRWYSGEASRVEGRLRRMTINELLYSFDIMNAGTTYCRLSLNLRERMSVIIARIAGVFMRSALLEALCALGKVHWPVAMPVSMTNVISLLILVFVLANDVCFVDSYGQRCVNLLS